jgi:hypothetical protein
MAIPKTVCKACRQGLNWELCGVEEKNPCTLCIERREECKSTLLSRQLDRLPTVSAYPNIQFPPNQTPSHPGAQISSLPSASDGSYSSYTLRPIHPGMPIAGSVQFYSGLGGHQHSDARASTVRQTQPTTREPAFPVQPQFSVSNPGPLAHDSTNQNPVSIFTVAGEPAYQSDMEQYHGTSTLTVVQPSHTENRCMPFQTPPVAYMLAPEAIDAMVKEMEAAESPSTTSSSETRPKFLEHGLRARIVLNLSRRNWDKDSSGFWTCPLDTSEERSCPGPGPKARSKEDIINHCISEHWGYNAMQSQRIILQCMKGLSLDDVIELYSDYQRFEKAYRSFRTMWIKWSGYSKRHDNLSPWNSKMEEAARHMLDKTQTEKAIECGPSTLDDSNRTFKDSDALEGWEVKYAKVGHQAS